MHVMLGHLGLYPRIKVADDLTSYVREVVRINNGAMDDASLCTRLQTTEYQNYRIVYAWHDLPHSNIICALRKIHGGLNHKTIFLNAKLLLRLEPRGWMPLLEKKVSSLL